MKVAKLGKRLFARIRQGSNLALLEKSRLFDRDWYVSMNPDVDPAKAVIHYLTYGGREGRAASPQFDSRWYLDAYPDVRDAGVNPLVHYLRWGAKEGRTLGSILQEESRSDVEDDQPGAIDGDDVDLVVKSQLFDPVWYVQRYPQVRGQNPYQHFLTVGALQGLAASPDFDCGWYLKAYPDVAAAGINPLIHYLRYGIDEGRSAGLPETKQWAVRQTLVDVKGLDPEIEACHPLFTMHLAGLPINYSMPSGRLARAWRELFADLPGQVDQMVFAPWLVRGGADLACVNVVRAAQQAYGVPGVLLVLTDHDRLDAFDWLPPGTQVLVLSDYEASLDGDERKRIVEALIFSLRPKSIMNVNSRACWEAIAEKGRALKHLTRLQAMLFCRDFTEDGRGAGFSDTHFRVCIPHLDKIYFDTRTFIREMDERYGLDRTLRAKLVFLPQPASCDIRVPRARPDPESEHGASRRVLWAGRLCHQKNTELLERIIRLMPDVSFDIWGTGDADRQAALEQLLAERSNVHLCGSFSSFFDLPLSSYSAYLFTSRFEGMPTVVINAAAANLPIVASDVGGVAELVTRKTGWLISQIDDENAYRDALSEIFESPMEVEQRVTAMRDKIKEERSWEAFVSLLSADGAILHSSARHEEC
jgi:glycosyltransferase involved in cell wall biosynthesis